MITTIIDIVNFLFVFSILVAVHELGHFLVAKKLGIWVEEFGFGIPPRAWGKKIGETIYSLNWLPFGGFVRLHGEDAEVKEQPERSFLRKSKKVRIAVVVAGVVMNVVLAIFCFAFVYSFTGIQKETGKVVVTEVSANSPASDIGLTSGDIIQKVDGKVASTSSGFITLMDEYRGKVVAIEVGRSEKTLTLSVTPRVDPPAGQGPLGVSISSTSTYFPPLLLRPVYGVYYGFTDALFWSKQVLSGFGMLFGQLFAGKVPDQVSGPIGIYAVTSEARKFGALAVINFMGILSLNLALINIMPFPALDGGRLLFILLEKLFGRKVLPKLESTIHTVGMVVLLTLIVALSVRDVVRIRELGGFAGFLDSLVK